jgi:nucleolar protein 56
MTDESAGDGWFRGLDPGDLDGARDAIEHGSADTPADWPTRAVEAGFAENEDDYYSFLHDATMHATREAGREREQSDDQQLKHSIRAMDDCERVVNELAERVAEWAGSTREDDGTGIDYARQVAKAADDENREMEGAPSDENQADPEVSLAGRVRGLADEAAALRAHVERTAPEVAPNLAALAGPVLAARLISLAGGLETLARKPAGTVQVLGAEDALFAHLRGQAPSPKHGVIFVHEAVQGTRPKDRGSAARALAGKLTIAARVDHYSGDRKPELDGELAARIGRIRDRETE